MKTSPVPTHPQRDLRRSPLLLMCICALATALAACSPAHPSPAAPGSPDGPPPRFAGLPRMNAEALKHYAVDSNKAVLVSLWAAWCEPCLDEMPFLGASAETYGSMVRIVALNVDDPGATTAARVDAALARTRPQVPLAVAVGGAAELVAELGDRWPGVLPYHVLLGADGRVIRGYAGPLDARDAGGQTALVTEILSRLSATEEPR